MRRVKVRCSNPVELPSPQRPHQVAAPGGVANEESGDLCVECVVERVPCLRRVLRPGG